MCWPVWQLHFRRATAVAPHRKIERQSDAPWAREVALKDDPWGARHGPAGYRHITWSVSDNPGPMCGPPAVRILHGRFDDFPWTGTRAGAAPPPPNTTMALGNRDPAVKSALGHFFLSTEATNGCVRSGRSCRIDRTRF